MGGHGPGPPPPASLGRRIEAFGRDYLVVAAYIAALSLVFLRVVTEAGGRLPWSRSLVRSAVKLAPWELAHACLWRIPGWPDAVETIPGGVVAGLVLVWLLVILYLLLPLMDRRRRTPYDRLAGSVVVRG